MRRRCPVPRGLNPAYRFLSYVDRSGGPDACWPWTGTPDENGYGQIGIDGRKVYAHRLALEIKLFRRIKRGLWSIHSCDNPPCCNPRHLREGTPANNTHDSVIRDRSARGERSGLAKLSELDVLAIRAAASTYRRGIYRRLAERFGITPRAASYVATGKRWAHLQGARP